ncbi:Oviduct-specific glycoprotein [Camelus dromedarius]|uniref:Oviduct-specific glycoprotein n=1 Tax=Camelus dromedarius TaxID=9838 RepID=A0A5N4DTY1_CAMDR|nr:Oviduct-specific glycoprotein [Camelus dromedarius]
MNNNQIVAMDPQDEKILYPEFNKLKERNRKLKTLLSIGGWKFGTSRFTTMLSTFASRKTFISSVIFLLRTHDFDGLDLFFLYPGLRGSPRRDRWAFHLLIEELLSAFQKEAQLTMRPRLLLSAAVSGDPHVIHKAYVTHILGSLLDFISVLTYDFHGSWEKFTGHHSPLFSPPGDPKSSAHAMNYWRNLGVPPQKLLMGFPTYGRTFRLLKASKNELRAEAVGPASPGKYTKQAGFLAYYEVCSFVQSGRKHWIDSQYVPYVYKGRDWIGFDDNNSFRYKAFFIKKEHFGGAMVWTLDLDDVKGTFCGTGPFPLVHTLNTLLVDAGGEAIATETYRKSENMSTISRGGLVTPTRETVSFANHTVAPEGKTETPGENMTPLGYQSVTPGEIMVAPVHLQTGDKILPTRRKTVAPEKMIVSSGKMTVTSNGQNEPLRGEFDIRAP